MDRLYKYVGPAEIRLQAWSAAPGWRIFALSDLERWIVEMIPEREEDGSVWATFVVDCDEVLRVADRHSERVACAGGDAVLAAGEIAFSEDDRGTFEVVEITNQSTGYCPEPESWSAVRAALERIPLVHPERFTQEMIFRRCNRCSGTNIVKDGWFECGECGAELPGAWNFG